jgi:hypothetical protein
MKFYSDIEKFNQIYKLPCNDQPVLLGPDRVENFRDILAEEVEEANDISDKYQAMLKASGGTLNPEQKLEILTDMSDWLGDIVVYCASEAKRWGLPLDEILNVIMQSDLRRTREGHEGPKLLETRTQN